jgi:hypothetical protein
LLNGLDAAQADDILIPMLTWRNSADGTFTPLEPANQQSWNWSRDYILQYSFVKSEKSMERVLSSRKGTGTAITIFNLKQPAEFVFQQADIQLRTDQFREEGSTGRGSSDDVLGHLKIHIVLGSALIVLSRARSAANEVSAA